jgi:DUF1016 N-terminal domain/UvrD-like helicase C-terminal domain
MRSIGQNVPLSHYVGRYGLCDRVKYLYESTTSINRWRMIEVIAMKVSKGFGFPVVALPGVRDQLAQEFGRGFEAKNLRRMEQFAGAFPDTENVASLMRHLSWTHFINLLPHQTEPARQFYASRAKKHPSASSCAPNPAANRWSCCKCTKTASPWPNTGPNCHPKRSRSKSCMQHCLKRVSGWHGAGSCWGIWMTSDEALPRPAAMRRRPGDFDSTSDTIKVMTMKVSKGLEFPVVALPGVGHMPAKGEDEQEAARVFYVAATQAMQRLVIGVWVPSAFASRL